MATRPPAAVADDWEDVSGEWETIDTPEGDVGATPTSGVTPDNIQDVYAAAAQGGPRLRAESLTATPWYQRDIPGVNLNTEEAFEAAPALAATAATLLASKNPGLAGIAGSIGGEGARQVFRKLIGVAPGTGTVQRALDLDPNSPAASVASFGGEAAAGATGSLFDRVLRALSGAASNSARRDIVKLLSPRTQVEKDEAVRLAQRAIDEGLVPAGSSRARQVALAQTAKAKAGEASRELERAAVASGKQVDAEPVLQSALGEIPPTRPDGSIPRTGRPQRAAATRVAEDVADLMAITGGTGKVPPDVAIGERRTLDKLLTSMYEGGRDAAPVGQRSIQTAADAWRHAIGETFPEYGAANLRYHDIRTITDMMTRALKEYERVGLVRDEADAVGAAAAGRWSIPFMKTAQGIASTGEYRTLSAAGKRLLANLLQGGAHTAQLWVRAAQQLDPGSADLEQTARRNRRAQEILRQQAEGVVAP